jgi:hypothetical protein
MESHRQERITVRFTPEEVALVRQLVKGTGLPISTYIRATVMKDVQAALPSDPLAQLKAREVQEELGAALAAMMVKAFKEAEREAKRKK